MYYWASSTTACCLGMFYYGTVAGCVLMPSFSLDSFDSVLDSGYKDLMYNARFSVMAHTLSSYISPVVYIRFSSRRTRI